MKAITNLMDETLVRLKKLQMSANFYEGKLHFFDGFNDYEFDEELVKSLLIENDEDLVNEFTNYEEDEDGSPSTEIMWGVMTDFAQFSLCDSIDKLITDKKL
jgi:hypothetical protein